MDGPIALTKTYKASKICIKFITWFHKFSITANVRIFQETEFAYLFLCTVNVNTGK
jgi:hypothetical protein